MDNQNFKKSVFGGFDRDEVLDYVDKMTMEYKEKIDNLEVQIRKDTAQKTQLQVDLDEANKKLELEKKDNERTQQLNVDLGKRIKIIMAENEELKANLDSHNTDLELKLKEVQAELADKSERLLGYTRLGISAEKVMKDAEERARVVTSKANNQSAQLLLKANDEAKSIIEQAKKESEKIRQNLKEYCTKTKEEMKDIESTLSNIKSEAQKEADLIINQAKEKAGKIDAITKDKLDKVNAEIEKYNQYILKNKKNMLEMFNSINNSLQNLPDEVFEKVSLESLSLQTNTSTKQTDEVKKQK